MTIGKEMKHDLDYYRDLAEKLEAQQETYEEEIKELKAANKSLHKLIKLQREKIPKQAEAKIFKEMIESEGDNYMDDKEQKELLKKIGTWKKEEHSSCFIMKMMEKKQ